MEKTICDNLLVDERELVEKKFYELTSDELDWEEIKNFVNKEKKKTIFYFDNELKRNTEDNESVLYAWIDTGYTTNNGESIFISLVNYFEYFSGHFIGTGKYLCNGLCDRNPYMAKKYRSNFQNFMKKYQQIKVPHCLRYKKEISDVRKKLEISQSTKIVENCNLRSETCIYEGKANRKQLSEVTEEIYANLLYHCWESIEGLDSYIKVIGRRVSQLLEKKMFDNLIMNKIESVIINTGLMDIYGNDILVIYRKHLKKGVYVAYKIISSKQDYLDEGFSNEQINMQVKPLTFFNENEQNFRPRFEEFDINTRCLNHIVEERKNRLPEKLCNESTEYVTQLIIRELQQGLKILERDYSYAKPIYSDGKISWLFPIRLSTKINEEPELVMVIRKNADFYELKTILAYDEVKDKITAMSLYHKIW